MATKIDNLANEIMEGLKEYADLASDDVIAKALGGH